MTVPVASLNDDDWRVEARRKKVINIGSGAYSIENLHPVFRASWWEEIRLDIDPAAAPDLLGSIVDIDHLCAPESFDAVWTSHAVEHLHAHEVDPALSAFRRILRPDGFALITCPDLDTVMTAALERGLEAELYRSPAGPITALDILFGHGVSITNGNIHMAHNTGFTAARLGEALVRSGFDTAVVLPLGWSLWAVALREEANQTEIYGALEAVGLSIPL